MNSKQVGPDTFWESDLCYQSKGAEGETYNDHKILSLEDGRATRLADDSEESYIGRVVLGKRCQVKTKTRREKGKIQELWTGKISGNLRNKNTLPVLSIFYILGQRV